MVKFDCNGCYHETVLINRSCDNYSEKMSSRNAK